MTPLGRDDYFRTALEVLAEDGPESLTIAELCVRLSVTKGSFYHHFAGMPGFVEDLLAFWVAEHNDRLIALSRTERDPRLRVALLVRISTMVPHEAEAAFRAWGRSNPVVAAAQQSVDNQREDVLTEATEALGLPAAEARVHGQMAMAMLLGVQSREHPVDVAHLAAMFDRLNAPLLAQLSAP